MTGGRRDSNLYHLDGCFDGRYQTVDALCVDIPRPPAGYPLEEYLQPHLLAVPGRSLGLNKRSTREASVLTIPNSVTSIPREELADLGLSNHLGATYSANAIPISEATRLIAPVDPIESVVQDTIRQTMEGRITDTSTSTNAAPLRGPPAPSSFSHIQRTTPIGAATHSTLSQQIRERDTYNSDVSAAGAIMALGFAYIATNNETVSNWLQAPNTYRELDSVRPDLLSLRTIAWGLVNYEGVKATTEWIQARFPACILKVLTPIPLKGGMRSSTAEGISGDPTSPLVMSTETDVENRGPRFRVPASDSGIPSRRQPLSPKLPIIQPFVPFTLPEASKSPVIDYSTIR